ncbi:MAG TPA: hypothetical protein VF510_10875 [Ktedonobacterales bacterium]
MDNSGDSDDFELEVTDLRTGQQMPLRLESPLASKLPRRQRRAAHSPIVPTPAVLTHRSASGALHLSPLILPRLASAAALTILLIITTIVVGSNPGAPAALAALIRQPFSTPAMPRDTSHAGEGSFLALDGVPWGTLLIDGKHDPRANTHLDLYQGSFILPPGRHTLEYRADPFPTLRCVVTVPAGSADTCPLISSQQAGTVADPFPPTTRLLDLRATPAHLPTSQQAALVAAIQTALVERVPAATATVLPGERYVTAGGSVAIATQSLQATFLYEFQWNAQSGLHDCRSLCVRRRNLMPSDDMWVISAHVRQGWRYTTADGVPVVPFAPPIATDIAPLTPSGASATDIFINLYTRWTGHWQVSTLSLAEFGDPYAVPTCAVGFEALLHVLGSANVSFTPIPPSPVANGCLFLVQRFTASGTLTGEPLYYLYRFGVLLAVNAPARSALPALPAASPAEQSLARQIAVPSGQSSP